MTFLEHILALDPIYWDYYQGDQGARTLKNPFERGNRHEDFIDEYFRISGKKILIEEFPVLSRELRRPAHITATFFLGLLVFHRCKIQNLHIGPTNLPGYETLPFLWFLSVIFHDFADGIERDENLLEKITTVQDVINHYDIKNNLLHEEVVHVPKVLFDSVENYFLLRRAGGRIDHGIHAGLYMYNALVENRQIKKKLNQDSHLLWDDSLDKQYAIASASIAIHNIWVAQDSLEYESHGLAVLRNFKGYSVVDFPIPYVFGLVDTIDPVKFFAYDQKSDLVSVVNSLRFEFDLNLIRITNDGLDKTHFKAYGAKIQQNMKSWLLHQIVRKDDVIEITMK